MLVTYIFILLVVTKKSIRYIVTPVADKRCQNNEKHIRNKHANRDGLYAFVVLALPKRLSTNKSVLLPFVCVFVYPI